MVPISLPDLPKPSRANRKSQELVIPFFPHIRDDFFYRLPHHHHHHHHHLHLLLQWTRTYIQMTGCLRIMLGCCDRSDPQRATFFRRLKLHCSALRRTACRIKHHAIAVTDPGSRTVFKSESPHKVFRTRPAGSGLGPSHSSRSWKPPSPPTNCTSIPILCPLNPIRSYIALHVL